MDTEPGHIKKDTRRRDNSELNQNPGMKVIRIFQLQTIETYYGEC